MMKKLLLIVFALATLGVSAQTNMFAKGDKSIGFAVGIGSAAYGKMVVPPISVSYEQGILDGLFEKGVLGVGGYLGVSTSKWEYNDIFDPTAPGYGYKYTYTIVGVTGTFHYPFIDKLDTYTTVLLGYTIGTSKFFSDDNVPDPGNTNSVSGIAYSGMIGAKYYFTDNLAAMVELGYGIAFLNIGLVYKF